MSFIDKLLLVSRRPIITLSPQGNLPYLHVPERVYVRGGKEGKRGNALVTFLNAGHLSLLHHGLLLCISSFDNLKLSKMKYATFIKEHNLISRPYSE